MRYDRATPTPLSPPGPPVLSYAQHAAQQAALQQAAQQQAAQQQQQPQAQAPFLAAGLSTETGPPAGASSASATFGSSSSSSSAEPEEAERDAYALYVDVMRRPIAGLQGRFSKYCQEVGEFSHGRRAESLDTYMVDDLRLSLETLDAAQATVLAALDPLVDLNFVHFKIFHLRELVLELITLIGLINAMDSRRRSLWRAVWLLFAAHFRLDIDSTRLRSGEQTASTRTDNNSGSASAASLAGEDEGAGTVRYAIWKALSSVASIKVKFAFKTALACDLIALFSVISAFADSYETWRGTWALVTVRRESGVSK